MKKWMTVVFVSIFALTLSMPGWAQSTAAGKNAPSAAQKKDEKDAKKEDAKKKKADKKSAKQEKASTKDAKKDASKK